MICMASPNFNARAANVTLDYAVVHYTGMRSAKDALARLCDPDSEVSAHYLIDEDGRLVLLVDEKYRAWHAGKSFWRGAADINSASIGIELVNPGHEHGYRPFPAAQIATLVRLLERLFADYNWPPQALLAHSDIAPTRKEDPGELFPWQELAAHGFGLWPTPTLDDTSAPTPDEAKNLLSQIGYDVTNLNKTITAFQRRYLPNHMTGLACAQTVARLRALARTCVEEGGD